MCSIRRAIDTFRESILEDYKRSPHRLGRDANSARATAADHAGRWPFELIQNSDDAKADAVLIRIMGNAVYVADTGNGLAAKAIESISGTHLPVKGHATIGCKGLGFKAVYNITSSPRVFTGADDGVLFDPDKARACMADKGFNLSTDEVPHEWLPFWISRQNEERSDSILRELTDYNTVVKLPITNPEKVQAAIKELHDLPPHMLLAFNHVRHLTVETDQDPYEITVARHSDGGNEWKLTDTRQASPVSWRVRRETVPPVPDDILKALSSKDQERARNATTLVAAPLDANGIIEPLRDWPHLCVYYPTESVAPVRLLLHADFIVESDRKRLTRFDHSRFNEWLADQLAGQVLAFVNGFYSPDRPWANIRLLTPHKNLEEHAVARSLWDRLKKQATHRLRLPNTTGDRWLTPGNARFLGIDVGHDDARDILKIDDSAKDLIHPEIESDKEACLVLGKLGCKRLNDDYLLAFINEAAPERADDHDWLWSCWRWLAAWAEDKHFYLSEGDARVDRVRGLPILPVGTTNVSRKELADRIVTWRGGEQHGHLPDWLAIRFIDDWFRDLIQELPNGNSIAGLLKALRIDAPTDEVLLNAFGKTVEHYWQCPPDNPRRFVEFLLEREWHEGHEPIASIKRCPILVDIEGGPTGAWHKARETYFGRAWGASALADIYEGVDGIAWAQKPSGETQKYEAVLKWLDVVPFPRLAQSSDNDLKEHDRLRVTPWLPKSALDVKVAPPLMLDCVDVATLTPQRANALLRLLWAKWESYYCHQTKVEVEYKSKKARYFKSLSVEALWFQQLKNDLKPRLREPYPREVALKECWLPDTETREAIGELLPIIDTSGVGVQQQQKFEEWFREQLKVRSQLNELNSSEWQSLLADRVPEVVSQSHVHDEKQRRKVKGWYELALDRLDGKWWSSDLREVLLLCRRGERWQYVSSKEARWLADDNELAEAFRERIWQFSLVTKERRPAAKSCFGLLSLLDSELVKTTLNWDVAASRGHVDFQKKLDAVKPFVYVCRCEETKEDQKQLRMMLECLAVKAVDDLTVAVQLKGHQEPATISKQFYYDKDAGLLYLPSARIEIPSLAKALTGFLGIQGQADFYENLIRCKDDKERKNKLLDKHIAPDDIDEHLREYAQNDTAEPPKTVPERRAADGASAEAEPTEPAQGQVGRRPTTSKGINDGETRAVDDSPSPPGTDGPPAPPHGGPEEDRGSQLSLKDPRTCEIRVSEIVPSPDRAPRSVSDARPNGSKENGDASRLSDDDRTALEQVARIVVERKLKEYGYDVEQMPFYNHGFDIRAKKGTHHLLVEVKGHQGSAPVVNLTGREWKEYEDHKAPYDGPERWELWNIEHLKGDDLGPATITKANVIPPEAVKPVDLRVDLRKCRFQDDSTESCA